MGRRRRESFLVSSGLREGSDLYQKQIQFALVKRRQRRTSCQGSQHPLGDWQSYWHQMKSSSAAESSCTFWNIVTTASRHTSKGPLGDRHWSSEPPADTLVWEAAYSCWSRVIAAGQAAAALANKAAARGEALNHQASPSAEVLLEGAVVVAAAAAAAVRNAGRPISDQARSLQSGCDELRPSRAWIATPRCSCHLSARLRHRGRGSQ